MQLYVLLLLVQMFNLSIGGFSPVQLIVCGKAAARRSLALL
jgi:hypothetical protein